MHAIVLLVSPHARFSATVMHEDFLVVSFALHAVEGALMKEAITMAVRSSVSDLIYMQEFRTDEALAI